MIDDAFCALRKQDWRLVQRLAQQILEGDQLNSTAMMLLGVARAAQGFEPEGENLLLAALTLDPSNAPAYYHLGVLVLDQGRCILAINAFLQALRLVPNSHAFHYQLGRAYERIEQFDEARGAYAQAVDLDPTASTLDGMEWLDFSNDAREALERLKAQ